VAAGRGEVTFTRYCAACHGRAGKADGPLAGELRTPVPDLTKVAERAGGKFEFEKVARRIDGREAVRGHGSADMPSWGEAFQKTSGTGAASVNEAVAQLVHFIWTKQAPAR
jgi:mono/diheme cytochrome c family protein